MEGGGVGRNKKIGRQRRLRFCSCLAGELPQTLFWGRLISVITKSRDAQLRGKNSILHFEFREVTGEGNLEKMI